MLYDKISHNMIDTLNPAKNEAAASFHRSKTLQRPSLLNSGKEVMVRDRSTFPTIVDKGGWTLIDNRRFLRSGVSWSSSRKDDDDSTEKKKRRHRKKRGDKSVIPPRPPRPPGALNRAEGEDGEDVGRQILRLAHELHKGYRGEIIIPQEPVGEGTMILINEPPLLTHPHLKDHVVVQVAEVIGDEPGETKIYNVATIDIRTTFLRKTTTELHQDNYFQDSAGNFREWRLGESYVSQAMETKEGPLPTDEVDIFQATMDDVGFNFHKDLAFFVSTLGNLSRIDPKIRKQKIEELKKNKEKNAQRLRRGFTEYAQMIYGKKKSDLLFHDNLNIRVRPERLNAIGGGSYEVFVNSSLITNQGATYRLHHGIIEKLNTNTLLSDSKFSPASYELSETLIGTLGEICNDF
jgi:hypothetical protein